MSVTHVSNTGKTLIDAGGASFNLAALPSPAAGNAVTVGIISTAGSITSVIDNQGNTYTAIRSHAESLAGQTAYTYRCLSIGTPSGAFTITVTLPSGNYSMASAVQTSSLTAVDQSGVHDQTTTGSLAVSTDNPDAQADDLSLGAMTVNGTTAAQGITTPSGYTSLALENDDTLHIAGSIDYKILSATGTETVTWGISASYASATGVVATLKGAGGAAAVTYPQLERGRRGSSRGSSIGVS